LSDPNDREETNTDKSPPVVVDFDLLRKMAGRNFRDLGGHPAARRGRVRRGRVFRSSHLAEVPAESPIKTLALKTLVTLQSRIEVRHLGPPEPAVRDGVRWEHIPIGDAWFTSQGFTRIDAAPGHEHLALVTHFRNDWQRFFKLLAERDVYPLLFHCSAGRDRTGVGAAMLLSVLGVDRERILQDFLASNAVFAGMPLTPEQLEPLFALIDESGGVDAFMRDEIGLAAEDLDAIRADLLED
jgi:protein-tyrosine phosphatase